MQVGIHKPHFGGVHNLQVERYEAILNYNNIDCIRLDANLPDFWEKIAGLDLFIFHWGHFDDPRQLAGAIMPVIEFEMQIKCFPDWATSWHFDDKIKQFYLLKQHGFPIVDSYIFWEKDDAYKWMETADLPTVFKLKGGAGSSNVILVKNRSTARRLINKMFGSGVKSGRINDRESLHIKFINPYKKLRKFAGNIKRKIKGEFEQYFWQIDKNYVLFQKYLPDNIFDTRVTVIGNRAFAFRRFNRDNDFRASGSGKINYNTNEIDMRTVKMAFDISKKLKFQSMAYDFLYNKKNEPEICEISYTYLDSAIYNCAGFWDFELNWHKGNFWPQYCILADALGEKDLKQPEMQD